MSRTRTLVVVALVVVFLIVGGVLIYANTQRGGKTVTINVTVTGAKTMSPSDLKATQDDKVTINVKSDQEGEVHLHVYDIAFEVKPGETTSHTFTADKTCTCEIEWEDTSQPLGTLTVSP